MQDFLKFGAVALLAIAGTLLVENAMQSPTKDSCTDCQCSEDPAAKGPRGVRAEVADLRTRVEQLEARLVPGLKPGAAGDAK